MSSPQIRIEALGRQHDRRTFNSGSADLDRYFKEQASQDVKRRIATCFVAVEAQTGEVIGFYTLAATSVLLNALESDQLRKLPRYPLLPAVLLGRLAIDQKRQAQGFGGVLLSDALLRASRSELGVYLMVVDAKDDAACRFYQRFGFTLLSGQTHKLVMPIATALALLA